MSLAPITPMGAGLSAFGRPDELLDHSVAPGSVHEHLAVHLLADGYKLVVDLDRSHGCRLVDARDGSEYLDCYSFFASLPIGFNHPDVAGDEFLGRLARAGVHKPANPDTYSV